jgi:hypothetical protein
VNGTLRVMTAELVPIRSPVLTRDVTRRSGPVARCLVCGLVDQLESLCSLCHSAYHPDCASYVGACSLYGCQGRLFITARQPVVTPEMLATITQIAVHDRWLDRCWIFGFVWFYLAPVILLVLLPVANKFAVLGGIVLVGVTVPVWCFHNASLALRESEAEDTGIQLLPDASGISTSRLDAVSQETRHHMTQAPPGQL